MGAVIDVGAMSRAVDRLQQLGSVHDERVSDDLHDEVHEAITEGLAWLNTHDPVEWIGLTDNWDQAVKHGFIPSDDLCDAIGVTAAHAYLQQQWVNRVKIQVIFDESIDQVVTVVE